MPTDLVIIGNTTNARLAHFYFTRDTDYNVVAFSVDPGFIPQNQKDDGFCGLPVIPLGELPEKYPAASTHAFVAVGYMKMNAVRKYLYEHVKKLGYTLPNYISPQCTLRSEEHMGDNNFILEDNTIQPFARIGSNNVLWSGNHIGHDVRIADHWFLTSHVVVSGFVRIESSCFLGVNATLRDGIALGERTLIGAGAVVTQSTEPGSVHVPARSVALDKNSEDITIS